MSSGSPVARRAGRHARLRLLARGTAIAASVMLYAGGPAVAGTAAPVSTVGGAELAAPGVRVATGLSPPPRITATAWLVADLDSGEVLAASNAHTRLAPASTLKILTAITLAPRLSPSRQYQAVDADVAIDGTKVGLVPGSRYTVRDLMYGLLLGSGNDAASALAALGGGAPATVALMNGEAARLQACDTHAANTSGLDARGQVSSAYDLALFGRAALADPQIARILATTRYRFPAAGTAFDQRRKRFEIQNHNRLLRNYPGATGVKNGFTELARGAFVGSAQRAGHRYVVTLVHAEGNTWHQAAALLDWAFAAGARHPATAGIGRLVDPAGPHGADGCRPEPAVVLGAPGGVTPAAAPATGATGPPTDVGEAVAIPTRWLVTVSASLLALIAAGVRLRRRGPRSGPPAS